MIIGVMMERKMVGVHIMVIDVIQLNAIYKLKRHREG